MVKLSLKKTRGKIKPDFSFGLTEESYGRLEKALESVDCSFSQASAIAMQTYEFLYDNGPRLEVHMVPINGGKRRVIPYSRFSEELYVLEPGEYIDLNCWYVPEAQERIREMAGVGDPADVVRNAFGMLTVFFEEYMSEKYVRGRWLDEKIAHFSSGPFLRSEFDFLTVE